MFKDQLARVNGLEKTGNWRVILPLTKDHNPVVLVDTLHGPGSADYISKHGGAATTGSTASAASTTAGGVAIQ
jgi:hypothetical protein